MAIRRNPITGNWEDDGGTYAPTPPALPVKPDEVYPSDLVGGEPVPGGPQNVLDTLAHPVSTILGQGPITGALDNLIPGSQAAQGVRALEGDPNAAAPATSVPSPGISSPLEPAALPQPIATAPVKAPGGGGASSKLEKQLTGDLTRAQNEQDAALRKTTEGDVARAGVEGTNADAAVLLRQQAETRRAEIEQRTDAEVAKQQARLDGETEKYKGMGLQDFWSHASILGKEGTVTGARILGALAMAMGAAGASLTGGRNYAMEIIDKAIDRDYQLQRDKIMKQKDVVTEARMGVEGARQAKADKLLSLENWRKNAYETAELQGKAMLSKLGPAEAEAKGAKALADLHERKVESTLALEKGKAQLAESRAGTALKYAEAGRMKAEGAGKPLSESQAKSADLAGRMQQDHQAIETIGPMSEEGMKRLRAQASLEASVANSPKLRAALVSSGKLKTPDQLLNDHDRLAFRAGGRFVNSTLRGDSGGAITTQEFVDFSPMYLPALGDKPQDLAAKKAAREQVISGKMIGAGTAGAAQARAAAVPSPVQGPAAKNAYERATKQLRDRRTGQTITVHQGPDGQWYPEGP